MAYEWVQTDQNTSGTVSYTIRYGTPADPGQPPSPAHEEQIVVPEPGYREEDLYLLYKDIYEQQGYEIREFRKEVSERVETEYVFTETSGS